MGPKMAQKSPTFDPLNFNLNLGYFLGQMMDKCCELISAAWIELSENQNFKKIGPWVLKIWAKKGQKMPFFEFFYFFSTLRKIDPWKRFETWYKVYK